MKTGTFPFHVGNFACLAILDGTFAYPPGLFFANLSREQYEPRLDTHGQQKGTIEVPYTCLYVDTGKERVLLDTGAGAFGTPPPANFSTISTKRESRPMTLISWCCRMGIRITSAASCAKTAHRHSATRVM